MWDRASIARVASRVGHLLLLVVALGLTGRPVSLAADPPATAPARVPLGAPDLTRLRQDLLDGDSETRAAALNGLGSRWAQQQIRPDASLLDGLLACTQDKAPGVRARAISLAGEAFVWRTDAPDPRAAEAAVRLARDPHPDVRYNAVYFALSVLHPKSDAVVAAVLDAGLAGRAVLDARPNNAALDFDPNLHGRICWGLRREAPERLAKAFDPYWRRLANDPPRAGLLYMLFVATTRQEPSGQEALGRDVLFNVTFTARPPARMAGDELVKAFRVAVPDAAVEVGSPPDSEHGLAAVKGYAAWRGVVARLRASRQLQAADEITFGQEWSIRLGPDGKPIEKHLAALCEALDRGTTQQRLAALDLLRRTTVRPGLDDWLMDALEACATDPDASVRQRVAQAAGQRWVWDKPVPARRAVELELRLARDAEPSVRFEAVYYGLSRLDPKSDEVLRATLAAAMALDAFEWNLHNHVIWALKSEKPDRLVPLLKTHWDQADTDPRRARLAYELYYGITRQQRPEGEPFYRQMRFLVNFGAKDRAAMDAEAAAKSFRELVPDPAIEVLAVPKWVKGNAAVVTGAARRSDIVEIFRDSDHLDIDDAICFAPEAIVEQLRQDAARARPAEKVTYQEAFADLHRHLGQVYPCFALKQIDWKKVGAELLPRAAQVKTDDEFGLLCLELVARLEDSHAVLQPGTAKLPTVPFPRWDVGLACVLDDRGRPVVFDVAKGSPADQAGIKPGQTVVSVNGVPAADALAAWMRAATRYTGYSSDRYLRYDAARMFHRQFERGAKVTLVLAGVDGRTQSHELPATVDVRYVPRLPVPIKGISESPDVAWTKLDDNVGYVYVRRIRANLIPSLDRAIKELGPVTGLIVDVRGNSGGGFDAGTAHRNFVPDDSAEPDSPRYAGQIALLIDSRCISAGEGWASWFIAKKRAKVFGVATAGASSRKDTYPLLNGLYQVVVPVKAYTGYLDRAIERRGLEPDVETHPTAKDLSAGRDTTLGAAKSYLLNFDKAQPHP